jgi:transposase
VFVVRIAVTSDARWALIEPVFNAWKARRTGPVTAARVHDLREIVNAILYVNHRHPVGVPAARLPALQDRLRLLREVGNRRHHPAGPRPVTRQDPPIPWPQCAAHCGAAVDAQSVKTSANVAETSQGIDAGKKIKGRKRHLITDTLGLVLAVLVTAANVHDTTGGKLLLDDLATAHPSVSKVWADGGAPVWASTSRWCSGHGRRGSSGCRNGG